MNKEELRKEFDKFMDEHPDIVSYDDYEAGLIFEWLWKHLEQRESDFKASLKLAIENLPNDGLINGRKKGRQALLDLIDNVKPSTSQPEGNTVNHESNN